MAKRKSKNEALPINAELFAVSIVGQPDKLLRGMFCEFQSLMRQKAALLFEALAHPDIDLKMAGSVVESIRTCASASLWKLLCEDIPKVLGPGAALKPLNTLAHPGQFHYSRMTDRDLFRITLKAFAEKLEKAKRRDKTIRLCVVLQKS